VPTAELARIGTVGELPAAPAAEVSVAADGSVFVDGALCDLEDVRIALQAKASAPGARDPDALSRTRLSVVLRVAAASRWDVVAWVLSAVAGSDVRVHRVFFTVRAEADDQEGATAIYLPWDVGGAPRQAGHRLAVRIEAAPDATPRETVHAAVRSAVGGRAGATAEIDAAADASFAAVIEVADLCLRAGATTLDWTAPRAPRPVGGSIVRLRPGTPTSLQRHVSRAGPAAAGCKVAVAGSVPTDGGPLPMVARVLHGIAGSTAMPGAAMAGTAPDGPFLSIESTRAVEAGLEWLAAHQSQDGAFEAEGFPRWCRRRAVEKPGTEGAGRAEHDVGTTGLALLAFLGAGYTNRSDDERGFGRAVAAGLRYLKNVQDAEGCFGPRSSRFLYSHAVATLAVLESYLRTRSSVYRIPAQKAVSFLERARNPAGVWRYGVRPGDSDTSATFWAALALHTARRVASQETERARSGSIPFATDEAAFPAIDTWLTKVTDPATGRVGYTGRGTDASRYGDAVAKFPAAKSEGNTATGVLLRLLAGQDSANESMRRSTALIDALPPLWNPDDGSIDLHAWHAGSLAKAAAGGDPAEARRRAIEAALIPAQRRDTDACSAKGSWDPIDPWSAEGGRVYMTAMACLCLEAPARIARLRVLDK
jgi:biopolymer transport protein ExbD